MELTLLTLASAALLSLPAFAGGREPGSLLVYPVFDSQTGVATILTVTNTNADSSYNPSTGLAAGTIDVEFVYINAYNCQEMNRIERLTPNDTFSTIANAHNAEADLGYVYVFAKHPTSGAPIKFDWLIGNELAVDGIDVFEWGMNPFVFKAGSQIAPGAATDLDGDGRRDLNGNEYEQVGDELLQPRFFGQGGSIVSELVLIDLTGTQFTTTIDLLIYNDNEQQFSSEYTFRCWTRVPLLAISGAFSMAFLAGTNDDPEELFGLPVFELGWFRMDGGVASSSTTTIQDPAFLAAVIERIAHFGAADLPFQTGLQANGDLLPRSVNGDNN